MSKFLNLKFSVTFFTIPDNITAYSVVNLLRVAKNFYEILNRKILILLIIIIIFITISGHPAITLKTNIKIKKNI